MNGERPSRLVVHLSDLHFGRENLTVVDALLRQMRSMSPDLIAISGDLTQRARRHQFQRARQFLDALPAPYLVVPGNHDVPLYNLAARLLAPREAYRRFITPDLYPTFVDDRLIVVGLDTTRPLTLKKARLSGRALARTVDRLRGAPTDVIKIVVGHHPFDAPDEARRDGLATRVLAALTAAGADVFLTGHLHVSYTGQTAHRFNIAGRSAIVVEAGTATSTRLREHPNAFNALAIEASTITVTCHEWRADRFVVVDSQPFKRVPAGWSL